MIDSDRDNDDAFQFRINIMAGDVTGDGKVDRADLVDLIHAMGSRSATAESLRRDLTGDGRIDVSDLRAALRRMGSGLPGREPERPGSAAPQAAVDAVFTRLGAAGASPPATLASFAGERDDRPTRRETPAFRQRLGLNRALREAAPDQSLDAESSQLQDRAASRRRRNRV